MIRVLPDTHTLFWLESESPRLSGYAQKLIREAEEPLYPELQEISEMHDRLIAACAIRYDAIVLTHDAQIRRCTRVRTAW